MLSTLKARCVLKHQSLVLLITPGGEGPDRQGQPQTMIARTACLGFLADNDSSAQAV